VPKEISVSVKMRLGFDDPKAIYKNAEMALEGGASWITVHGRTKTQGYKPPAYWDAIGDLVRSLPIPVVANGEIWTMDDFRRCQEITGAKHFMLGRGALANPLLVQQVAEALGIKNQPQASHDLDWQTWLQRFSELALPLSTNPNYVVKRLKQWLRYADQRGTFQGFHALKTKSSLPEFMLALKNLS
jgi:tRNA-dihydrouridine synthase C